MEFDYIIVGAGSAGCAIANRLSENRKYSVALLEAGGKDTNPWIHIPVGYFKTMGNPKTDWRYKTEADDGINGRSIPWPRGRVLGGSSSINGLLYVRGQSQDFDNWRDLGNSGWGWDEVLPFFKKAETWKGDAQSPLRGHNGPLSVSPTRLSRDVVDRWVDAAVASGYKRNKDYNAEDQEGVGYFQLTADKGRRCSSAVAYLNPAKNRKNLHILTNTQVEKIIFKDGRASGVNAIQNSSPKVINARKEIILSAGAIGSPQILQTSGIGNSAKLKNLGIEALSKELTVSKLKLLLNNKKKNIKNTLIDQSIIAGIGNIYASEILYRAKIHPKRSANSLSDQEVDTIIKAFRFILKKAIKVGGTTIKNHAQPDGKLGYFSQKLKVYGRTGQKCFNCKNIIINLPITKRSTFYCNHCQI